MRHFRPGEAPEEGTLAELFELAALAPSVGNCQPTRLVRVDDEARRPAVRADFEAANREALGAYGGERAELTPGSSSPACAMRRSNWRSCDEATEQGHGLGARTMPEARRYSTVCALHTFWLAARARGLGVGWVSILDPAAIADALDVPRAWTFIAYLCVGFPRGHVIPELERAGWQVRDGIRSCGGRRSPAQDDPRRGGWRSSTHSTGSGFGSTFGKSRLTTTAS